MKKVLTESHAEYHYQPRRGDGMKPITYIITLTLAKGYGTPITHEITTSHGRDVAIALACLGVGGMYVSRAVENALVRVDVELKKVTE